MIIVVMDNFTHSHEITLLKILLNHPWNILLHNSRTSRFSCNCIVVEISSFDKHENIKHMKLLYPLHNTPHILIKIPTNIYYIAQDQGCLYFIIQFQCSKSKNTCNIQAKLHPQTTKVLNVKARCWNLLELELGLFTWHEGRFIIAWD